MFFSYISYESSNGRPFGYNLNCTKSIFSSYLSKGCRSTRVALAVMAYEIMAITDNSVNTLLSPRLRSRVKYKPCPPLHSSTVTEIEFISFEFESIIIILTTLLPEILLSFIYTNI